jgi:hypothetical protein
MSYQSRWFFDTRASISLHTKVPVWWYPPNNTGSHQSLLFEVVCEMGLKYHRMRQTHREKEREREREIWREIGGYCSLADKWTLYAVVVN